MHFTREPIVETIITPKEGHKLVIRNSKGEGQEEFFVDSVEVINFGQSCFYRGLEKPKSFLLPVTDYEVLEVRETRMVLKTAPVDQAIKIGGGKETSLKVEREESEEPRRKERRRQRKRRVRVDEPIEASTEDKISLIPPPTTLIPPPTTLISETIARYKEPQLYTDGGASEPGFLAVAEEPAAPSIIDKPSVVENTDENTNS